MKSLLFFFSLELEKFRLRVQKVACSVPHFGFVEKLLRTGYFDSELDEKLDDKLLGAHVPSYYFCLKVWKDDKNNPFLRERACRQNL